MHRFFLLRESLLFCRLLLLLLGNRAIILDLLRRHVFIGCELGLAHFLLLLLLQRLLADSVVFVLPVIVYFHELRDHVEDIAMQFSLLLFAQLVIIIFLNDCIGLCTPFTFFSFRPRIL